MDKEYEYEVSLSFAGEDRKFARCVADKLKRNGINLFYDEYEQINLWGKDLYVHLDDVYRNKSKYCIIFISDNYAKKVWTNHERQSAQARAFLENEAYILPFRLDSTEIPGIRPTTGYLSLENYNCEDLANAVTIKLGKPYITLNEELNKKLEKSMANFKTTPRKEPILTTVTIKDENGQLVNNAQIVLIADNSTYLECKTDIEGKGQLEIKNNRIFTLLIAHLEFQSTIIENYTPQYDLEVTLNKTPNYGSIVVHSTGYIPGLKGRLNPILDTSNRTYLYAENIAINGGVNQPATFTLNNIVMLEDSDGIIMNLMFRFIKGHTSLIDFVK